MQRRSRYRYRKRRYRKKRYGKRWFNRQRKSVLRNMLSYAETKFKTIQLDNTQLRHNVGGPAGPVVYGNLLRSDPGVGQNGRIGDSVYAVGLSLKMWLSTKSDRPNVMFRVMIIQTPTDQINTGNPANLWRSINNNRTIDFVNTDVYRVVYNKILKITHGDTSFEPESTLHEVSKYHKVYIPLKRKLSYQTDTGGTPVPKQSRNCLSLVIMPYDAYGTLELDVIASMSMAGKFYYKDF